jgi:chromosome segregation ATPase
MFKKLAKLIGDLPWWLLLLGGPALIVAAALYTARTGTPSLVENATTPEMKVAISHEIKRAEGQAALDIGRLAILKIQSITSNAEMRAQLEEALQEIEQAKEELSQQNEEVEAAKREVRASLQEAAKERGAAEAKANAAVKKAEEQVAKRNQKLEAAIAAAKANHPVSPPVLQRRRLRKLQASWPKLNEN